jgi:cobalamin biosynthesis protein CbiD
MGDARNEVIAAHAAASGADTITVQNILKSNTTDKATELLNKINLTQPTYDRIAQKIYTR